MIDFALPPFDFPKPAIIRPAPTELLRYGGDPMAAMLPGIMPVVAGAGGPAPIVGTPKGQTINTGNATTYNFTGRDLGDDTKNRLIVVGWVSYASSTVAVAVTAASQSGDIIAQQNTSNITLVGLAAVYVPAGETGTTISVQFGGSKSGCVIYHWVLEGPTETTPLDFGVSTTNPGSDTLTTRPDGYAVGMSGIGEPTSTAWTGLTELYDGIFDAGITGSAASIATTGTSLGITSTYDNSGIRRAMVVASW